MNGRIFMKWCSAILLTAISLKTAAAVEKAAEYSGKPILTIFANYKAGLGEKSDISGFNLDRAFVGYEGTFSKGFSAKILVNIETVADANGSTRFGTYLKNAQIDWKRNGLSVSAGLVNLRQFSEQENFWGHRYIFKSFQEEYGIVFCEDIGVTAGYEFSPAISADIALTNGEGRRFKNMDNRYKYGAGITLKPLKGLVLRIYGDIFELPRHLENDNIHQTNQYSAASFAGYADRHFSIGAEYNKAFNYRFGSGNDVDGYSIYATADIVPWMKCFGRFDMLYCKAENRAHELSVIGGLEFSPVKQIRVSPNYQGRKNAGGRWENYLLLSVECKL